MEMTIYFILIIKNRHLHYTSEVTIFCAISKVENKK